MARFERDMLIVLALLTLATAVWDPGRPRLALGVVGGGVLAAIAYWAIRGLTGGLEDRAIRAGKRANLGAWPLVKFFTRHAILALAGYGMMTRLELDPIGLLIGVSTPGLAATLEAVRVVRGAGRS